MTIEEKAVWLESFCEQHKICANCLLNSLNPDECPFDDDKFVERAFAIANKKKKRLVDMSKAHGLIMDSFATAFETVLDQIEDQCSVDVDVNEYEQNHPGNDLVSNWKVYGLNDSIRRSKYPMSVDISTCTDEITKQTNNLAMCETGTGHDNWLNGVIVQFDLTYTVKAWTEAERYHFFDFVSSQSTMHRIANFDLDKQYDEHTDPRIIEIVKELAAKYNETKDPEDYLRLLMSNPCGFKLTAGMTTNYRQLKTIYQQRKTHRLPEWRKFCAWIETLPHSEWITGKGGAENA